MLWIAHIISNRSSIADSDEFVLQRLKCLLTYTSLHNIALHCYDLPYPTLPSTTLYNTALHCHDLPYPTLPSTTLYKTALHCYDLTCPPLPCTTLYYPTLHCTTLHYTEVLYPRLHCNELHCITLRYMSDPIFQMTVTSYECSHKLQQFLIHIISILLLIKSDKSSV